MKSKHVLLASAFLISSVTFAQKDELKTLKKIYDKDVPSAKDVAEYKSTVAKAEPLVANSNESDKVYFGFYKSLVPFIEMSEALAKPQNAQNPQAALKFFTPASIASLAEKSNAVIDFEKNNKQVYTKDIQDMVAQFKPMLLNYAVGLGEQKRYADAASVLNSIYLLDKKDAEKLYYAASYALNAKDYDKALEYYGDLKKMNFSGEKTLYYAKNKANDSEDYFDSKASRDNVVKLGSHMSPRDEKEPSKRGEIYKNIALILAEQGKIDEAKKQMAEARLANPDDQSLATAEANLYLQTKDYATYKTLVLKDIEKNPNSAVNYYNLGVITSTNDPKEAAGYYNKAIQLDPNNVDSYVNLAGLELAEDVAVVDEMKKLGTSANDNKRYAVLKTKREGMFKKALPYLKKAVEIDPKNEDASSTLLNVYNYLEMTAEAKALKAKTGR